MNFENLKQIYHFLFETYEGVCALIGICLVISLLLAIILEHRTRKRFIHSTVPDDVWEIEDDTINDTYNSDDSYIQSQITLDSKNNITANDNDSSPMKGITSE